MSQRSWWQTFVPRWRGATSLRHERAHPDLKPVEKPTLGAESGVSGTAILGGHITGEEYNPELRGQAGLAMYDKMRRSDAQVRATLQVMKLPLLAATWQAVPPEGGDDVDQQIADFVNLNLFDDDGMTDSWHYVLRHILLQLDFGFSLFEMKWRVDHDGHYYIERMAPRLPKTIHSWHLSRDGELIRVWQYAPVIKEPPADPNPLLLGRPPQPPTAVYEYLSMEGSQVAVFTFEREGDNLEGTSMLRSSYRNFFYKDLIYHLDGVRLDRYGVGIPVAKLDETNTLGNNDMDDLEQVLQDLRSNQKVWLIEPVGVTFRILTPEGGGGAAASAGSLIDHHDMMISRNVLAGFLTIGKDSQGFGSAAYGSRLTDMFISSLYGVAAGIAADLKKAVIRPLCQLNFNMTGREFPSVVVRDLETNDIERMAGVLLQAVGTLITPDDDLEAMLRKALKLPPLPEELSRKKAAEAAAAAAAGGQIDPNNPNAGPVAQPADPDDPDAEPVTPEDADPAEADDYSIRPNEKDLLNPWTLVRMADGAVVSKHSSKVQARAARLKLRGERE